MKNPANADTAELEKFSKLAALWWDKNGAMGMLHRINPLRTQFIANHVLLTGKKVIDIGCGGGILSESLARAGAEVTGIDLSKAPLEVARQHAQEEGLNITYLLESAEAMAEKQAESFDVVVCLEMLEHVPSPEQVVAACAKLLKPGGKAFFSTINRTPKAFLCAILIGEYVLNILPRGTHSYRKLIKPTELQEWSQKNNLVHEETASLVYNPLTGKFKVKKIVDINYIACYRKT